MMLVNSYSVQIDQLRIVLPAYFNCKDFDNLFCTVSYNHRKIACCSNNNVDYTKNVSFVFDSDLVYVWCVQPDLEWVNLSALKI